MTKPDRLYISKIDRKMYEDIDLLNKTVNKEAFLIAMSFGFKNKIRTELKKPKDGFFLLKYLNSEDIALMKAVALADVKKLDILVDESKVFQIVEEYAHSGIKILSDLIKSRPYADSDEIIEKEISKVFNELKFLK